MTEKAFISSIIMTKLRKAYNSNEDEIGKQYVRHAKE